MNYGKMPDLVMGPGEWGVAGRHLGTRMGMGRTGGLVSGAALQGRGPRGGCLLQRIPRVLASFRRLDFGKWHARLRLDRAGFQLRVRGILGPVPNPSFAHLLRTQWVQLASQDLP